MDMYVGDVCYLYAGSICMYAIPISDIHYPSEIHYPSTTPASGVVKPAYGDWYICKKHTYAMCCHTGIHMLHMKVYEGDIHTYVHVYSYDIHTNSYMPYIDRHMQCAYT